MDKDGTFRALNTDTGKVEWERKIGSLNASAPAYANGRLFAVNLEPHQAVALRPKPHGSDVLWRHPLPGRSESSPLVHRGRVILGCESGDIFALDEKTGKTRWTVSTAGAVKGGLALQRRHGVRRQLRGRDLRDRRLERQRQVDGQHAGRRPAARRRHLLHPGGGLGAGLSREPRRAHLQLRREDGRARLEPFDGRRGLPIARRRGHAELAAHGLCRLAGQALLRARRPHGGGALGAPARRNRARVLQRGGRDRLRLDDRAERRHHRLQGPERQEGLRVRAGRVQPGDLGRREGLHHRLLDRPRLQAEAAPSQGREETVGAARTEAAISAPGSRPRGGVAWPPPRCACHSGRSRRTAPRRPDPP